MNFDTHNDLDIEVDGTGLQGYIDIDYEHLVEKLGEPIRIPSTDNKVDAEWKIRFDDGLIVTIYNWKNGPSYNGGSRIPVENIKDWNIGGYKSIVVHRIEEMFPLAKVERA